MPNTWQSLIAGDGLTNLVSCSSSFGDALDGNSQTIVYSSFSEGTASLYSSQQSGSFSVSESSTNFTRTESGSNFSTTAGTCGPLTFTSSQTFFSTYQGGTTNTGFGGTTTASASQNQAGSVSGSFNAGTVFWTSTNTSSSQSSGRTQSSIGPDTTASISQSTSETFTGSFLYAGIRTVTTATAAGGATKTLETTTTSTATVSTLSATTTGTGTNTAWATLTVSATRTHTTSTTAGTTLTGVSGLTTTYRVGSQYPVPVVSATGREWLFAYGVPSSADSPVTALASSFSSSVFSRTLHTFSRVGGVSTVTITDSPAGTSALPATRTVTALSTVTALVALPGNQFPATGSTTVTLSGRTTSTQSTFDAVWTTSSNTFTREVTRTFSSGVTVDFLATSSTSARHLLPDGSTATAAVAQTFTSSSSYTRQGFDLTSPSIFGNFTHLGSRDFLPPFLLDPATSVTAEQAALAGGYRAGLSIGTSAPMGSAITAPRSYFLGGIVSSRAVSGPTEFHEQFGISTTQTSNTSVSASVNTAGAWQITTADTSTSETFTLSLGLAGVGSKFSQAGAQSEFLSLWTVGHGAQRHSADSTFVRLPQGLYRLTTLDSAGASATTSTSVSLAGLTTAYTELAVAVERGPAVAVGNTLPIAANSPNTAPFLSTSHADL